MIARVALAASILLSASAARAQCPSCSNPNIAVPPRVGLGAPGAAPQWMLRLEGAYVWATRLQQGWGATEHTRDLMAATHTLYQHRALRLAASLGLGERWSVEAEVPYEEREMTNRDFPPEGASGIRRHLLLTGFGDAFTAVRLARRRDSFGDPWSASVAMGAMWPTGPTRVPEMMLPVETVMQIGSGNVRPTLRADTALRLPHGAFVAGAGEAAFSLPHDAFRRGAGASLMALAGWRPEAQRFAVALGPQVAWRGADFRHGETILNTGGEALAAVAAAEAALPAGMSLALSARRPLLVHTTGTQLVESWALALGVAFRR